MHPSPGPALPAAPRGHPCSPGAAGPLLRPQKALCVGMWRLKAHPGPRTEGQSPEGRAVRSRLCAPWDPLPGPPAATSLGACPDSHFPGPDPHPSPPPQRSTRQEAQRPDLPAAPPSRTPPADGVLPTPGAAEFPPAREVGGGWHGSASSCPSPGDCSHRHPAPHAVSVPSPVLAGSCGFFPGAQVPPRSPLLTVLPTDRGPGGCGPSVP